MQLKAMRILVRFAGASLFIIGSGCLLLMSPVGTAPSFWYLISYCALFVVGVLWLWSPALAAALSIGPLISVVALTRYVPAMILISRTWAGSVIVGLVIAVGLVLAALRGFSKWRLPVALSLIFVTCAFTTDRLCTNKITVRSYQMSVALDGHAPWGIVGPEWSDSSAPIVVYRRVGNGYCYNAFKSEELRQLLAAENGHIITVEYNIFSDFGKERGYNVRSVDGLLLANGQHPVRDIERFGGQILGNAGTELHTCP